MNGTVTCPSPFNLSQASASANTYRHHVTRRLLQLATAFHEDWTMARVRMSETGRFKVCAD